MGTFGVPSQQIEISSSLEVLDDLGRPVNFGWARRPFWRYESPLLSGPARRLEATDRYLLHTAGHIITLQVTDGGASGHVGLTVISLKEKKRSTQIFTIPFPLGRMGLPNSSEEGQVRVQKKKLLVEFTAREGGVRIIRVDIPRYGRSRYLRGELVLSSSAEAESLTTLMPWLKEKNAFVLSRHSWHAVEGIMQFGPQEIPFPQGRSWALYEWRRGIRPRSDLHYQAGAAGMAGGRAFGFTAGYGDADSGAGTENAVFLDGRIHKLDQVTFHISPSNWMEPWRFTASDNRLEMTFTPLQERTERNAGLFHSWHRRQLFGSFSGRVILDDGLPVEFSDLFGMVERRKSVN